ncbi:hypothetical protein HPP92_028982, partial [Vanilla planifolia]
EQDATLFQERFFQTLLGAGGLSEDSEPKKKKGLLANITHATPGVRNIHMHSLLYRFKTSALAIKLIVQLPDAATNVSETWSEDHQTWQKTNPLPEDDAVYRDSKKRLKPKVEPKRSCAREARVGFRLPDGAWNFGLLSRALVVVSVIPPVVLSDLPSAAWLARRSSASESDVGGKLFCLQVSPDRFARNGKLVRSFREPGKIHGYADVEGEGGCCVRASVERLLYTGTSLSKYETANDAIKRLEHVFTTRRNNRIFADIDGWLC